MPENPKVGLTLSGGAARGLAHIGVLKALEEESIPIDTISGTSAGALVGACYAKERKASALEELALGIYWWKLAHLIDLNLILLWKGFVHRKDRPANTKYIRCFDAINTCNGIRNC